SMAAKGEEAMKALLSAATAVTLLTAPAMAGNIADQIGPGGSNCAEYTHSAASNPTVAYGYYFWAQGFMTASNLARITNGADAKNLAALSIEAQMTLLRVY